MAIGGRPREEGGHRRINISLNAETYNGLCKIEKRGQSRSSFVETALGPLIRDLDPGDSCETLHDIDCLLRCRISEDAAKGNFEKAAALTAMGNVLKPFRSLCHTTGKTKVNVKTCSCKRML